MTTKTTTEVTGYDLSTTGPLIKINAEVLLRAGWIVTAGSTADFAVEVQPENSTNWYTLSSYSSTASITDRKDIPEAFQIRIRNTSTVADTADAVIGGAYE